MSKALTELGIEGMTTIDVKRFRRQEGHTEIYRGSEYSVDFIPKVLILVIVADAVVEIAVKAIVKAGKTGAIGDGAVFISTIDEALRSYENQRHRASGLNLLVAAIILWNTTYLQRAVDHLRIQGHHPASGDLAHLSPLGWEHINLTGDYRWDSSPTLGPDEFRPLRTHAHDFAAAA
jgi:nitrogen regulatory protein PII